MKISQNSLKRYDIDGIKDPGKNEKKGKKKIHITGIAGYKGFIGCLLKLFGKAVSVKTKEGTIYLNCKSIAHWYKRVNSSSNLSEKELSKLSHNSRWVKQQVSFLMEQKQRSEAHNQRNVVQPSEPIQEPIVEIPITPEKVKKVEILSDRIADQIRGCPPVELSKISSEELTKDKSEILPNLFLGTSAVKEDFDLAVFAYSYSNKGSFKFTEQFALLGEDPLRNRDQGNLQAALLSIDKALESGQKVLICDREGKHRSACLAAAYLIKKYNVTADQAFNFLESKRPIVSLNEVPDEEENKTTYMDFLRDEFKTDFDLRV